MQGSLHLDPWQRWCLSSMAHATRLQSLPEACREVANILSTLQGAADVKADQGAGKADSKPAADAEADGKGSKAEAAQESLKSGGQGGETKAAEAQPDKAGAEGDKGAAEMDVEHKAKPEAAGETGDV